MNEKGCTEVTGLSIAVTSKVLYYVPSTSTSSSSSTSSTSTITSSPAQYHWEGGEPRR